MAENQEIAMDGLRTVLFEDPLWLYVVFGFAEAVLLLAWRHWRSPGLAWALLVPPVLAAAVGLTAWKVTTDREQVAQRLGELAFAFERGQHATVVKLLDPEYRDDRHNFDQALNRASMVMERYKIERVKLSDLHVEVDGDRAISQFNANVRAKTPLGTGDVPTSWTLWWMHRPEGWRVISARLDGPTWVEGPGGP